MQTLTPLIALLVSLAGCSPADQPATESSTAAPNTNSADTVYSNGRIYTVNEAQPWAESVAIKDGKFLVVGSNADVQAVTSGTTKVIDLEGKLVIPGLIDPHTHAFEDYRNRHFTFGVKDNSSPESILAEVKVYAAANPDKEWIMGGPFPSAMFENDNPGREMLDEYVPDRPACIVDQNGHTWWCNSMALELTGILDGSADLPDGAIVERDEAGVASGTVREHTIGFMRRFIPAVPQDEWLAVGRGFMQWFSSLGLTSTRLAAGNEAHLKAARSLEDDGELSVRLSIAMNYGYFDSPETIEQEYELLQRVNDYRSEFVRPTHVKIFLDGVPTTHTGWMVEPYTDAIDNYGYGYYDAEALEHLFSDLGNLGLGVMTHATGSRSVREILNAIEAHQTASPDFGTRHHVTHNGVIHPDDIDRYAMLDIAADLSPTMPIPPALANMGRAVLGDDRVKNYSNPRAALDAGAIIAIGSDFMVSFLDPWRRIAFHVSRIDPENQQWGVLDAENALTLAEAIMAYTLGAAYAIDLDTETGSIETGKYADMIVLDRDVFEIEPVEIADTKVLTTVFAGKMVYEQQQ